jgi:hypothetical protein
MDKELKTKIISSDLDSWLSGYFNVVKTPRKSAPEKELKKDKIATLKEEEQAIVNDGYRQDQELKGRIFNWVQRIVTCYLIFIAVIICFSLPLSDPVIIALLTTTTITIVGLPAFIIHSLFPKNKKEK